MLKGRITPKIGKIMVDEPRKGIRTEIAFFDLHLRKGNKEVVEIC